MKKPLAIFLAILILIGAGVGAFFITKIIEENNSALDMSDAEYLVSGGQWKQKDSNEKVIWAFEKDGTCKVTTNGDEYFDCQWYLDEGTLGIKTDWLVKLEDEFEVSFNKTTHTFTATSKSDQKVSEFQSENDFR